MLSKEELVRRVLRISVSASNARLRGVPTGTPIKQKKQRESEVVHGVEQKEMKGEMNVSRDGMAWSEEEVAILREFYQKCP